MIWVFFSENDENTVLVIDTWENQAALDIHHKSPMMKKIANLRGKYELKMRVEQYIPNFNGKDFESVIRERTATRKFK